MQELKIKIGDVDFVAEVKAEKYAPDIWGESRFVFSGDIAERLSVVVFESYTRRGDVLSERLRDAHMELFGEEWNPGDDLILDTDQGIAAIAFLLDLGSEEPIRFKWEGGSSPFWLFHDLAHAVDDFSADAYSDYAYAPSMQLTGWEEDRASVEGSKLAVASGVPLSTVLVELGKIGKGFKNRFGVKSEALKLYAETLD